MRVCSGCLATDGRLFDIRERLLEQAFAELTGLTDRARWLCAVCLQLLRKFTEFRARCVRSRRALRQLRPLNQVNLLQIDRTRLKHNLSRSEIIFLNCDSVETDNVNDTISLKYYIKSDENDSPTNEYPMKYETYHIKKTDKIKNDDETEIHDDILDNTQFSSSTDLTNPIDDIKYENECTNIKYIMIEPIAPKYELLDTNDDDSLKEKSQVFENNDNNTSSNERDNDFLKQKINKKRKKLSANEKKIINDISQLFRVIWRNVIKDDGDFYGMFERLYKVSLDPKLIATTVDSRKCKRKNTTEQKKMISFLSMYKQVADINNVSIEFISIEAERLAMDSRRKNADARQCALCCRVYATADTRRRHEERSHNESLSYRCLVCLYTFNKRTHYLIHLLKMHATKKTCNKCSQNIPTVEQKTHWHEVHKHVNEVHRKGLVNCQYCDQYSFVAKKHYYNHIRAMHRTKMDAVQCLLCGDTYNGQAGLRGHIVRIHPMAVKCGDCATWFESEDARVAHTAAGGHCRKDLSGCPLCGCTFPTERLMREHYDRTHALYKCSKCILTFIELKSYKDHYKKMCCDGSHRLPRALNNKTQENSATDNDEKKQSRKNDSYICDICGKSYDFAATLRYHQRLHTGEKPYKCEHCGKTFRLGSTLKIHIRTHTGERRYKCGLCLKAFRQLQHLKLHMPSHTKEKKYGCTQCSKRFMSGVSLRHHVRTVHDGLSPLRRNRHKKKPLDVNDLTCT